MFKNVIGNELIKAKLENIILTGQISHSYIFSGIEGIGKFLFAKDFAKALLCLNNEDRPCNTCRACISFDTCNNPDLTIIDEQNNSIKTEQIKTLVNNIFEKPVQSKSKVFIINNSENMTKEAQNSLLKTLEEPPNYAIIILITKNENLLLNTIKSRCIKIQFNKLNNSEIKHYFDSISENINDNMYEIFDGSIGKALNLRSQIATFSKIDNSLNNIENMNELEILKLKEELFFSKEEVHTILDYMNILFLKSLSDLQNSKVYFGCMKIIENTKLRLKANSNYDMTIDNLLISICEELRKGG